jgi:hypothetical protein
MSTSDTDESLHNEVNSMELASSGHQELDQELGDYQEILPPPSFNEHDFVILKHTVETMSGDMVAQGQDLRELMRDMATIKNFIITLSNERKPVPLASSDGVHISQRLSPGLKANKPKPFTGVRSEAEDFVFQCGLNFNNFESTGGVISAQQKQTFFASYLLGDALKWYQNSIKKGQLEFASYEEFVEFFTAAFGVDDAISEESAIAALSKLIQTGPCSTYSNLFLKYASHTQHNEYSKMQLYKLGLKSEVRSHLNHGPPAKTLSELMRQCILFDDREYALTQRRRPTPYQRPESVVPTRIAAAQISKDLSSNSLSVEERKRRRDNHLCPYCGEAACPGVRDVKTCTVLLAKNGSSTKGNGARA